MKNANWQTKKLGEVCDISAGNSAPQNKDYFIDGKYPFFRTSDVGAIHLGDVKSPIDYLNEKGIKGLKLFKKDTILLPKSGASTFLNHRVILGVDGYVSSHLATIKTDEKELNNRFLYYLLREIRAQDLIQDHKYPSLNLSVIENIEISYPSLSEQHRIVKILDGVFEKIAKAKGNTEKNLQNIKELFEGYKFTLFYNKGENFDEKELGEICDKITQGPNPKYDKDEDNEFRVLKTKNLYDKNIFYEEADKVSRNVFKTCLSSELKNGDVLLAIVGQGSINKCNVFENKTPFRYIYTRALGLIRAKSSILNPHYLKAFLQSNKGKKLIDSGVGGTSGQQIVTTTHIKTLKIPLPSLREQKTIVKKLDDFSDMTKKLEDIYQQKLANLEELKKSVLAKAFAGEL